MGWTNDQATEITAPSNVPFQPGNDVIGMGTALPPELITYGVTAALVFYNSAWSPSATTPSVKFMWIGGIAATGFGQISIGMGICQNPSVSQTAVITSGFTLGMVNQGGVGEVFSSISGAQDFAGGFWQVQFDATHKPIEFAVDAAVNTLWHLPATAFPGPK